MLLAEIEITSPGFYMTCGGFKVFVPYVCDGPCMRARPMASVCNILVLALDSASIFRYVHTCLV